MGSRAILPNKIGWLTVDNVVDEEKIQSSLLCSLKSTKRIKRRTKALNKELKKFSQLKTYSQYVITKTNILRNITDSEDTDDDNDAYSDKRDVNRETLSPSPSTADVSTGSDNLDYSHYAHSTNLPGKQQEETRKVKEIESNLSKRSATRKNKKQKQESVNNIATNSRNNVPHPSVNKYSTRGKSLINVRKDLSFVLENLDNDTNSVYTSERINPIAESTHIHDEDRNDDVRDNMESSATANDESLPNGELQDSTKSNNYHDDSLINENTTEKINKITDNGDGEINVKYEPEQEQEEEKEQKLGQKLEQKQKQKQKRKQKQKQEQEEQEQKQQQEQQELEQEEQEQKQQQEQQELEQEEQEQKQEHEQEEQEQEPEQEQEQDKEKEQKLGQKLEQKHKQKQKKKQKQKEEEQEQQQEQQEQEQEQEEQEQEQKYEQEEQEQQEQEQKQEEQEQEQKYEQEQQEQEQEQDSQEQEHGQEEQEEQEQQEQEPKQEQPSLDETLEMKRFQPVITSTEIVKEKYTIIRNDGEIHPADDDTSFVDDHALKISPFSPQTEFSMNEEVDEVKELSPETKRVRQLKRMNLLSNSSDSEESEDDDENDHRVVARNNVVSPNSTRIDDSEETDEEILDMKKFPPLSSQVISDPSDSEESIDDPDETMNGKKFISGTNNQHSSSLTTISVSKSGTCTATKKVDPVSEKTSLKNTAIGSVNRSIKSQIREQENIQASPVFEKIEESDNEKKRKKEKKERNLEAKINKFSTSRNSIDDSTGEEEDGGISRTIKDSTTICSRENNGGKEKEEEQAEEKRREEEKGDHSRQRSDETSSRPIELCDFIDREGLVATQEISTITAKDLKRCAQEDGDEEIWLMEIPRSIIANGSELCGKNMSFKKGKMTINDTTYKTSYRDKKSMSCILSSGRKKARYKTVNVEPVGCIVVRQQSSDKTATSASLFDTTQLPLQTDAAVQQFSGMAPFPKNLKSRNPHLSLNSTDRIKDLSRTKDTHEILELKKKRKRKRYLDESNKSPKNSKKVRAKGLALITSIPDGNEDLW